MSDHTIKVLLIEDTVEDARIIQEVLTNERDTDFHVKYADWLSTGLSCLRESEIDVVLLDLTLPDSKGLETLVKVRGEAPRVPVVVLTATDDEVLAVKALQYGAQDYLVKGLVQIYPKLLSRSVRYAIERKRAEEAVRDAHTKTERLLASITSILIGVDPVGLVTHWNAVAERTFGIGVSHALGRPLSDCEIHWEFSAILQGIATSRHTDRPTRLDDLTIRTANGNERVLGITIIPLKGESEAEAGLLIFGADITERREAETERARLQEQLLQSQKMETIGRFAGGIAHDFDNFLQAILGFAWLVRMQEEKNEQVVKDVDEIIHATESASAMVRQLLAFGRRHPLQPKRFDINRSLTSMARLLKQFVGEGIRVDLQLASDPLFVNMDPTGLEQMVMNLCKNARDAMSESGTLTVTTEHQILDAAFEKAHSWAKAGEYVRLAIKDTGTGMDAEVAAHMFEPFFTTKKSGRGTGLGLAVVYGLVKQHEGLVDIETAPGQGTTLSLYFPLQTAPRRSETSAQTPAAGDDRADTVWLLEHDDAQRAMDERSLTRLGYVIAGARDQHEVTALFTQRPKGAAVAVLDVALPGAQTHEMIARLRASYPHMKILLIGKSVNQKLRAVVAAEPGTQILLEPYLPAQLVGHVRRLLDEPVATISATPVSVSRNGKDGKHRLLIVDDDPRVRTVCERALQDAFEVTIMSSAREALSALTHEQFDLLLTDLVMPGMDGFTLLEEVAKCQPDLPRVVMSGSILDDPGQRERLNTLCREVIRKPFTPAALKKTIRRYCT